MMKVLWPFGVALRGEASNHLRLRWLKTVVVSVREKARHRSRQVGTRKTFQNRPVRRWSVRVSLLKRCKTKTASKPGVLVSLPGLSLAGDPTTG